MTPETPPIPIRSNVGAFRKRRTVSNLESMKDQDYTIQQYTTAFYISRLPQLRRVHDHESSVERGSYMGAIQVLID